MQKSLETTSRTHEQFYTDRHLCRILWVEEVTYADKNSWLDFGHAKREWI